MMSHALHDDALQWLGSELGEPEHDRFGNALEWLASGSQGSPFSEADQQRLAAEEFRQREIRAFCKLAGCDSDAEGYIERGVPLGSVMRELARDVACR